MTQHASLSPERWASFDPDQRLLMIANEMVRAGKLTRPDDTSRRRHSYERVLQLTDLTVQVASRRALRRELLRWRDLAAVLYITEEWNPTGHAAALRVLLRFSPVASRQIPYVLGGQAGGR